MISVTGARVALDSFDIRILDALQSQGRLTNGELAERIGLSASQCSRRRAALEASGVIESYAAVLSAKALGLGVTVFVEISLHAHSEERARQFIRLLDELEEVQQAFAVTGDVDYLLKVVVADLSALSHLLNNRLLAHESVARIRSSIALECLKETSALPLGHMQTP